MKMEFSRKLSPEKRLEIASERMFSHLFRKRIAGRQAQHLKNWTIETAHAVFDMHPELRYEGSLARYFVVRAGWKKGLRGAELTAFVEKEYQDGTWWKMVPSDVLQGKPKHNDSTS